MFDFVVVLALLIPVFTGIGILAANRLPDLRDGITILGAVSLCVMCAIAAVATSIGQVPQLELFEVVPGWLSIDFKLEPLGAMFMLVASSLWIVNSLYSFGYMRGNNERNQTRFYLCFAIALLGVMGVAMAANLFTLFIFYEILTLATYPLVAHKGDSNALSGARVYLMTLLGSSICMFLVAIIWTGVVAGTFEFVEGGSLTGEVDPVVGNVLLLLFAFGIGKAALMPLHFWLPKAMVAPTPVSALLHAVAVVKAGVFTILKVSVYIFGVDLLSTLHATDWILAISCFTIIVASLIAMTNDNLKARLAYSTVAQLAYVTAGAMLATTAGWMGGGVQIIAHAAGKITLFMCAGAIYVATGLTNVSQLKGLGRKMPVVFIAFFIGALSIIGVPPFAGSWSKFFLLQGAVEAQHSYVVWVLIISSLLNIAYLLPIPILALMPPEGTAPPAEFKREEGVPILTVVAPAITAILCFLLFFAIGYIQAFLSPAFGVTQ